MKRVKRVVLVAALVSISLVGAYGFIVPTSAQDYVNPPCECKYPGPPEQYGIKKPTPSGNGLAAYTCEVTKCWLPVNGLEGETGPNN